MSKKILIEDIRPKSGRKSHAFPNTVMNAEVVRNKSIRIFGTYGGDEYDNTFEIGDAAEYGSFNLIYWGRITGITDKTVTISKGGRNHRLSLEQFSWRNRNFDFEKVQAYNATESMNF